MLTFNGICLGRTPIQGRQRPAKAARGLSVDKANQIGVLRGLVSLYSLKLVTGTKYLYCGLSQARQKGEATLRTLVTGLLPTVGGCGKPQCIWINSRSSSCVPTTGAI